MSQEENGQKEVVLSADDMRNVVDFFNNFSIPIPDQLKAEIDNFNTAPDKFSIDDQERFKIALCAALATADHELLRDELFKEVIDRCTEVYFENEFTKQMEGALGGLTPEQVAEETKKAIDATIRARKEKSEKKPETKKRE